MLNTYNTNEIKNAAGVEKEFIRRSYGDRPEWKLITETPNLPHRFSIAHQELGSGTSKRRRSNLRFEKTVAGTIDSSVGVKASVSLTLDVPIGNIGDDSLAKELLANLMSFLATTGAGTTVLFDCSGTGCQALINSEV